MSVSKPTRRSLLGAGAAGAGAAAFGGFSLEQALAESGGSTVVTGPSATGGLGPAAVALPPTIPGTRTKVVQFADSWGLNTLLNYNVGAYPATAASVVEVALGIDAGARMVRIDMYGTVSTTSVITARVAKSSMAQGSNTLIDTFSTSAGPGAVSGAYTTPYTLVAGEALFLELLSLDSTRTFFGAIVTYYDAKPALNLLAAPIRIYDSRPGSPPAGGTKSPLANGATRTIDAKVGGAVPAGAKGALVNVTCVGTSAGGFLALFKGGIAWPGNSSINWDHAGQVIANTTVVAVDANANIGAYANVGCSTDFLIDVIGYYA